MSSPTPIRGGRNQPGRLPVTGSDTGLIAAGGAVVLLLGGLLALIGRRRDA